LVRAHLIECRLYTQNPRHEPLTLVTLTEQGRQLLDANRARGSNGNPSRQAVYAGLVRPKEILHDATLYRLYLTERSSRAERGQTVRRVSLDHELKAEWFRSAAVDGRAPAAQRQEALERAAAELDLPTVDGHVQLPDLRLELEDASGHRTRVDLELVTEAYHAGHRRAKAQAGFTSYLASGQGLATLSPVSGTTGKSRAGRDPDIVSSLLSL
jgi:hypothetical protein